MRTLNAFMDRYRTVYAEVSALAKLARLLVALDELEAQWRQTAESWEQAARDHRSIDQAAHYTALAADRTTCADQLAKVRG